MPYLRRIAAIAGITTLFLPRIATATGDSAYFGRQKALIPAFWK